MNLVFVVEKTNMFTSGRVGVQRELAFAGLEKVESHQTNSAATDSAATKSACHVWPEIKYLVASEQQYDANEQDIPHSIRRGVAALSGICYGRLAWIHFVVE